MSEKTRFISSIKLYFKSCNNKKKYTQESYWQSDDTALSILHLYRSDIVHFTAERTAGHRDIPVVHRYSVLADDSRCKRHAACRVFVVGDLSRYGLSIGPYQVRRVSRLISFRVSHLLGVDTGTASSRRGSRIRPIGYKLVLNNVKESRLRVRDL